MRSVQNAILVLTFCILAPAVAQENRTAITLERHLCFGACPAYLLQIDSSRAVSFKPGPPSSRLQEFSATITADQFREVVSKFETIHFFELKDHYEARKSDGQEIRIQIALNGRLKEIRHYDDGPLELMEAERFLERMTNIHRWLHGTPKRFTLNSAVARSGSGQVEDLKNEPVVWHDVYSRIKPGMSPLMEAAGLGETSSLRTAVQRGEDVDAPDETGWSALMITAVSVKPESVAALLDAGAHVDQNDRHGDTALLGAAAVRFGDLRAAAGIIKVLLAHGASPETTNDLGESALMWAARSGNLEAVNVLLAAGANPGRLDQSGHDALFYARAARVQLTFDPSLVERYNQVEPALEKSK